MASKKFDGVGRLLLTKVFAEKKYPKPCQTTKKYSLATLPFDEKNNLKIVIFFQIKRHIYWQILHQLLITDFHHKNTFLFFMSWIFLYTSIVKNKGKDYSFLGKKVIFHSMSIKKFIFNFLGSVLFAFVQYVQLQRQLFWIFFAIF